MTDITSKSIEDLLKAVNDASGSARALFVTLMVLALYFLIVVSGTDDMALLRNATVAVPTLSNATLPARAFYICAPLVFVFLHLDLLIHLKLLSDKLFRFNQLLETSGLDEQAVRDYRLRLAGFPFSNWLGSDPRTGRRVHALQGAMVWLTLVLLPLTVLMVMQLGFLAYQSEAVTWLHRVALIVDAGLLLYFWVAFRHGRYRPDDARPGFLIAEADKAWRRQVQRFRCWRVDAFYARKRYWRDVARDRRRLVRMVRRALPALRLGLVAIGAPLGVALLLAAVFGLWGSGHVVLSMELAFLCLIVGSRVRPLFSSFLLALRQSAGDIAFGAWTFALRRWPVLMPAAPLLLLSLTVATIPDEAADRTSRWLYSWMEGGTRDSDSPQTSDGLGFYDLERQITVIRRSLDNVPESPEVRSKLKSHLDGARCMRWLVAVLPGMPDAEDRLPGTARQGSVPTADKASRSEAEREASALAFHLENANRMPPNMRASCPTIALFHLKGGGVHRTLTVTGKVVARSDIRPDLARDLRASLRDFTARAERREGLDADLADRYLDLVAQIEGLDLSERSLRWADFTDVAFPKANFARAQLQHAKLRFADLRALNLEKAWLTGADLKDAVLTNAQMNGTILNGVAATGANFIGATLVGANISGARLTDVNMSGATLTNADMSGSDMVDADMVGVRASGLDMRSAQLDGANMGGATLTGADMRSATLTGVDLTGAKLTGADMRAAELTGTDARFANLTSLDLRGAVLIGAALNYATLTGTTMKDARLISVIMDGAELTGTNLSRVTAKGSFFPTEPERKRWMIVDRLATGRYTRQDVQSSLAELTRRASGGSRRTERILRVAITRLERNVGSATNFEDYPECIGGLPCRDADIRQNSSALNRAAHFENLICGAEKDGLAPGKTGFGQDAYFLVKRLIADQENTGEVRLSSSPVGIDSEERAVEHLRSAAAVALRRLATRGCAPPQAQALIDNWARENSPLAKEHRP